MFKCVSNFVFVFLALLYVKVCFCYCITSLVRLHNFYCLSGSNPLRTGNCFTYRKCWKVKLIVTESVSYAIYLFMFCGAFCAIGNFFMERRGLNDRYNISIYKFIFCLLSTQSVVTVANNLISCLVVCIEMSILLPVKIIVIVNIVLYIFLNGN